MSGGGGWSVKERVGRGVRGTLRATVSLRVG